MIANVQTLQERYDDDQLSGVERGGVVSVKLPLGFSRNVDGRNEFYRVLSAVRERLSPELVLVYGKSVPLPTGMNYKFYENDNIRVRRAFSAGKGRVLA